MSYIGKANNDGYVLTWDLIDGYWQARTTAGGGFTAGGDLSGSASSQRVIRIQQNPVNSQTLGATQDGYVLTWLNSDGYLAARPTAAGFTAGGDLSGTSSSQHVVSLTGSAGTVSAPGVRIAVGTNPATTGVIGIPNNISITARNFANNGDVQLVHLDTANQVSFGDALAAASLIFESAGVTAMRSTQFKIQDSLGSINSWIFSTTPSAAATITPDTGMTSVTLQQADRTAIGATGSLLAVQAQNATGIASTGGDLVLKAGTGTTRDGYVIFNSTKLNLNSLTDGYVLTYVSANTALQLKPATAAFTAAGDLSGTTSSQTVIKINGATVPTAGALTTGNVLQVNGVSSTTYAALNLAGGSNFVTGVLPSGNVASHTGDVTGAHSATVVAKINGATVPAAGALTTGNVLQVNGISAVTYGALNLAGGSNFVTGALPTVNQVAQNMNGDISGTTATSALVQSSNKLLLTKGMRRTIRSITANTTVSVDDDVILVGTLSSSITITLPASPTASMIYDIKDANGSAASFNIIISGNGSNIDAAATKTLATNYESATLIYNSGKWSVL